MNYRTILPEPRDSASAGFIVSFPPLLLINYSTGILSWVGGRRPLAGVGVITVIPRLACLWLECAAGYITPVRVIWSEDYRKEGGRSDSTIDMYEVILDCLWWELQ